MPGRVICVSRSLGAGGDAVARRVADALGYRYVDDEIVMRAADRAGVSPEAVGRAEQSKPMLGRILEALAAAPMATDAGAILPPQHPEPSYEGLIERVIHEVAEEGGVVIVAHGASIPLAGKDGVLRVLVTASPEVRAARESHAREVGIDAAWKAVEKSDRERVEYFRRMYKLDHELPTHYDMTVNTDAMSIEAAARLVVEAARA